MEFEDLPISEKEKRVNEALKELSGISFIMKNLNELGSMAFAVIKVLSEFDKKYIGQDALIMNNSRMDFNTKIKMVESFYKSIGIQIDIDKMISEGDIELYNNDDTICSFDRKDLSINSVSSFLPTGIIQLSNTGKSLEAAIYAHEIAHYLDNQNTDKDFDRYLLDETLAVSTEMIFNDYAKEKYNVDLSDLLRMRVHHSLFSAERAFDWFKYLKVYKNEGVYNMDSYSKFYNTKEDYEQSLDYFDIIYSTLHIGQSFGYTMAMFFAPYIAYQYKNNLEFRKSFKDIYETRTFDDFLDLSGINLNYVSADSFSVFLESYIGRALNKGEKKVS